MQPNEELNIIDIDYTKTLLKIKTVDATTLLLTLILLKF